MTETPAPDAAVQAMLLDEARRERNALQRRALTLRDERDQLAAEVAALRAVADAVLAYREADRAGRPVDQAWWTVDAALDALPPATAVPAPPQGEDEERDPLGEEHVPHTGPSGAACWGIGGCAGVPAAPAPPQGGWPDITRVQALALAESAQRYVTALDEHTPRDTGTAIYEARRDLQAALATAPAAPQPADETERQGAVSERYQLITTLTPVNLNRPPAAVWLCETCGALVGDRQAHDRHHATPAASSPASGGET